MFTGIIRYVGEVQGVQNVPGGRKLRVELGPLTQGLALGDSVAVSGVCLSATTIEGSSATFDAVAETLDRTRLGGLAVGDRVNLERAVRADQALDGHIVQGHVDGLATMRRLDRTGGGCEMHFDAPEELVGQMVPKGSVAVDGVSLTLASVSRGQFSVALIPTTLKETTLGELRPGQAVNIETDIIGKYVLRYLGALAPGRSQAPTPAAGGLTLEKLQREGFA